MLKFVVAGAAALAIAGSSAISAQPLSGRPDQPRWQLSQEDVAAFAAARIAGLKAGLVLTVEQEKNWPAFESALQDLTRFRLDRRAARPEGGPSANPTERLRRYADALSGYSAALKNLADAQEPLYNSLDVAQKRRFAVLAQPLRQARGGSHHHGMRGAGPGQRRGPPSSERRGEEQGGGGRWHGHHNGRGRGDGGPRQGRRGTTGEDWRL